MCRKVTISAQLLNKMQFYYEFEKHLPNPSHFQFTKIHQQYFQDNTVYLSATIFDLLKNLIHIVAHFFEKRYHMILLQVCLFVNSSFTWYVHHQVVNNDNIRTPIEVIIKWKIIIPKNNSLHYKI